MLHILERFLIHFFSSAGVLLCAVFAYATIVRRLPKAATWLPSETFKKRMVFLSVVILLVAFAREAWDVHKGQVIAKAFTDYASWALGLGCSIWAIVRVRGMRD